MSWKNDHLNLIFHRLFLKNVYGQRIVDLLFLRSSKEPKKNSVIYPKVPWTYSEIIVFLVFFFSYFFHLFSFSRNRAETWSFTHPVYVPTKRFFSNCRDLQKIAFRITCCIIYYFFCGILDWEWSYFFIFKRILIFNSTLLKLGSVRWLHFNLRTNKTDKQQIMLGIKFVFLIIEKYVFP